MKFRVLLLLALFLTALFAVPVQAQQALLLLEKGSIKVIGPERTRLCCASPVLNGPPCQRPCTDRQRYLR